MTVLSVIQEASSNLGITRPTAVMASTTREHVELKDCINDVASTIAKAHEWRALAVLKTYTGDGSEEDFDLPSDFDRMHVDDQVWSSTSQRPLSRVASLNDWQEIDVLNINVVFGAWIIYGGQMHIKAALANAATATHWYQSNLIVTLAGGGTGTAFVADGDTFRLNERLLKLGLIWTWKKDKGRAYAEDLDNYEELKEKLINADKGARKLIMGRRRFRSGVEMPYPGVLGP